MAPFAGRLTATFLVLASIAGAQTQVGSDALLSIQNDIQAGDLDTAWQQLTKSLSRNPRDGGLLNLRGIVHAQRHELAQAKLDFQQAVQLSPQLSPAWQNLGRACGQLNDSRCAIQAWNRVLRIRPADKEAHEALAELYYEDGRFAQSLNELDEAKADHLLLRCLNLCALGRVPEAEALATRLARQATFTEADLENMHAPFDSPKMAPVVIALVKGLDARGAAGLPSLQRLVIAYEQLRRPADARKTLERVAKLDPENTAHLLELARLADDDKKYEEALGFLAHARDLQPRNPRIHFLFGLIAGELDLPLEARRSLEQAVALDPENADFNYALGTVILTTRDAATAATYLERFVQARPGDGKGHCALGVAYFASGDYDRSKQQMDLARRNPKTAAAAEYYLGRIARLEGDLDAAVARFRKSIQLMPGFSETHTELARIALEQGRLESARSELSEALRLAPNSFQANQQLLVLYKRTRDARAEKQAMLLQQLDEERSRRADLMLRTIEVRP